jgi:protoporphyrinogen oxidase
VRKFLYPKYGGIGELARGYAREIRAHGGEVLVDSPAIKLLHDGQFNILGAEYGKHKRQVVTGDKYVNTIPITSLIKSLSPRPPQEILDHVAAMRFMSIVFVYLKLDRESVSPDSWIYLPENHLTVHRISEFRNFSRTCAPQGKTMICAEITCRRGDAIWRMDEPDLRDIAERDLVQAGLIEKGQILGSFVKRVPFAYPVYDLEYEQHLLPIQEFVAGIPGLITTGRQGNFRYNNMDQSVEMGRSVAEELHTGLRTGHEAVATGKEYFG